MKDVQEYGILHEGKYLTEEEHDKLVALVTEICDNHSEDEWWKIAGSIQGTVNTTLIYREVEELKDVPTE